jgi:hypothetical protein
VFLVNSRLGLFTAASVTWRLFSRSYEAILPSSLTRVLPRVLGFSPRLPVSVCGTGIDKLDRGFSWQYGVGCFATCFSLPIAFRNMLRRICLSQLPTCLDALNQRRAQPILLRHPISQTLIDSTGISTCSPSPTLSKPRLRSRLTLSGRAFLRNP